MKSIITSFVLAMSVFSWVQAAETNKPKSPPTTETAYLQDLQPHDNLWIGAQPQEKDLADLAKAGVTHIINFRTPKEMEDRNSVSFDEAAEAKRLGLDYTNIPLGGKEYPYNPFLVDELTKALKKNSGIVLLHCASGSRASLVWAAYAVKHLGMSPDAALRATEPSNWPLPFEKLLGHPLRIEYAETSVIKAKSTKETPK